MELSNETEAHLLARAAEGDSAAHEHLFRDYYSMLEAFIAAEMPKRIQGKIDPADIIQVTYEEAFRNIAGFEYRGKGSFPAWLKRIARNRLIDQIRKVDRGGADVQPDVSDSVAEPVDALNPYRHTPGGSAARRESAAVLEAAIRTLPSEKERRVLELRFFEGLEWESIVSQLGGTKSAARSLCHRALSRLKGRLGTFSNFMSRD